MVNNVMDFFGNTISIGDKCLYWYKSDSSIYPGIISGVTKSGLSVRISIKRYKSSITRPLDYVCVITDEFINGNLWEGISK